MARFRDIPRFYRANYAIDVDWKYLEQQLANWQRDFGLDLEPDFQRAHVWDDAKRTAYVEYRLREGQYARDVYFNCTGWDSSATPEPMVIVDGKQRLEAVRRFVRDELPAFGLLCSQYEDRLRGCYDLRFHVADFATRAELLRFYLDVNAGGVVHTQDELDKVRRMLAAETRKRKK